MGSPNRILVRKITVGVTIFRQIVRQMALTQVVRFIIITKDSVIDDSKLITIVRSIPFLYESNFGYFFHRTKEFEQAKTLENFYAEPRKYFNLAKYDSRSMFARNAMAYDLGYQDASKNLQIRKVFKVFIQHNHANFLCDYKNNHT